MKKIVKIQVAIWLAFMVSMAGCFSDHSDIVPIVNIDPSDARALSQVLILPDGSSRFSSGFPTPTQGSAPSLSAVTASVISSNGGTIPLVFRYTGVSNGVAGCYVQVTGADAYFQIPRISSNAGASGQISVPITIPTNVLAGRFCIKLMIYDGAGRISNIAESCVQVLRLGTGSLQVSLAWTNTTDQDLYVTDPTGEIIWWSDKQAASGGQLDRDDTDGYGPENIFWLENAPDGAYKVGVDDYSPRGAVNEFFVTVTVPGRRSKTFTGSTGPGRKFVDVVTIKKSGTSYDF